MSSQKRKKTNDWANKQIELKDVASKIDNGSKIYIGSCAATPEAILEMKVAHVQDFGHGHCAGARKPAPSSRPKRTLKHWIA